MKNLQIIKTVIASLALVIASGCASIVTDSQTAINVQTSNGQKVKVTVDGMQFDVPGVVIAQKNGMDKVLTTNDSKCASATIVPKKIEGAFWGNILAGGVLGSTTDSSTNKMWTYEEMAVINCNNG